MSGPFSDILLSVTAIVIFLLCVSSAFCYVYLFLLQYCRLSITWLLERNKVSWLLLAESRRKGGSRGSWGTTTKRHVFELGKAILQTPSSLPLSPPFLLFTRLVRLLSLFFNSLVSFFFLLSEYTSSYRVIRVLGGGRLRKAGGLTYSCCNECQRAGLLRLSCVVLVLSSCRAGCVHGEDAWSKSTKDREKKRMGEGDGEIKDEDETRCLSF